jgi:type IV pilus assembly protein PilQ
MKAGQIPAILLAIALLLPAAAQPADETGKGPPVTMELKDVEFKDMLRAVAQEHGINIHVHEDVKGKVTASIRDIPLWEALGSILHSRGFDYRMLGSGLYVVEPMDPALVEERSMVVREFRLRYLRPDNSLMDAVNSLLSGKGRASHLRGSNALVVKDIPLGVRRVEELIAGMDRMPRQIMIEARIVEVATAYKKELGIDWGVGHSRTSGNVFGGIGKVDTDFNVNLPSASEGGLSLSFGLVSGDVDIDLKLSALEDAGEARILSRPGIMVMENQMASIADGMEILIPTLEAATVIQTGETTGLTETEPRFMEAKLELAVTPRAIGTEQVALSLNARKEEFDFDKEFEGFPPKRTRSAKTDIIIKEGETLVIGGIYTKKEIKEESRVPLLWKIPLLGHLFRKEIRDEEETELIIFLTPTIIKDMTG